MKVTFLKCQNLMFFSIMECKKRKSRSLGKHKNGNIKSKICIEKRLNTSLKDLSLCASVYMCFVATCWERTDLLALVCGVYCEFVTFPLVSWVRCGA